WQGSPAYRRVRNFLTGVLQALPRTLATGRPLYLVLDGDLAQTAGAMLREELGLGNEVLVIDGVALWDFDYIDLGKVRLPSNTVPVTVKSLLFGAAMDPADVTAAPI